MAYMHCRRILYPLNHQGSLYISKNIYVDTPQRHIERKLDLVCNGRTHSYLLPHWASEIKKVSHGHLGGLVAKSCPILVTPWTIACQGPLSTGFSRQEYWSGLPFPSPGDLSDPGIKPRSPALRADSLQTELPGKPQSEGLSVMSDSVRPHGLSPYRSYKKPKCLP